MEVRLVVTEGPHAGKVFAFAGHDTFVVGRSARAHFRPDDADRYFSRAHFVVEVNPPRCRLTDLGSRNGTFVNGRRETAVDLKPGDLIRAGHTAMRLDVEGETTFELVEPAPPPAVDGVPDLPGFRVVRELGRGGMGVVYLAEREADGSPVAVKTIATAPGTGPAAVQLFLREAEVLRQLDHRHVVRFHEMGDAGGVLYFAMEYVEGTDAGRVLKERGPLPVRTAVRLVCQALSGLAHAHSQRFVHRDVKPANLLVGGPPGKREVKLADFGLARVYQASQLSGLTATGDVRGTPAFMPPEQILNFREAKPPADIYATAATLYRLLTAAHVHDFGGGVSAFKLILGHDPVPIRDRGADVPRALAAVIDRALDRDPDRRWPTAAAFRDALVPFGR